MITDLTKFSEVFKRVAHGHISVYSAEAKDLLTWSDSDFDTRSLVREMDREKSLMVYSALKKAYDVIRVHYRTYRIYGMSRGDYYRAAISDREKDALIMDRVVINLNKVYVELKELVTKESPNGA